MPPPSALTSMTAAVLVTVEIPLATRAPVWLIFMPAMDTVLGAEAAAGGAAAKACVRLIVSVMLRAISHVSFLWPSIEAERFAHSAARAIGGRTAGGDDAVEVIDQAL